MRTPDGHHVMTTMVTDEEMADYRRLAGEAGLPVAHWVRKHLNVVVGRAKLGVAETKAAPDEILREPVVSEDYRRAGVVFIDGNTLARIIQRLDALEKAMAEITHQMPRSID